MSTVNDFYEVSDLQMPDGSRYTGQLSTASQMKHGYGVQTWLDGAKYEGEWRYGKADGKGTFYHANGDVFDGYFKADKANGHGVYQHKTGQRYNGQWADDVQ